MTGAAAVQPAPPAPVDKERKWVPAFAVLLVIAAVLGGGLLAAESAISDVGGGGGGGGTEPAPIQFGPDVALPLAEGWQLAGQLDAPYPGARVSKGNGSIDAFAAASYAGDELALWNEYANFLAGPALQFQYSTSLQETEVAGLYALLGSYVALYPDLAAPIEGEVITLITGSGTGVVLDGWAPQGQYALVKGEVDEMIAGLRVG